MWQPEITTNIAYDFTSLLMNMPLSTLSCEKSNKAARLSLNTLGKKTAAATTTMTTTTATDFS